MGRKNGNMVSNNIDNTDCFAYSRNKCKALKEKKCEGCSFYKTVEQHHKGQRKAMERINLLDKEVQDYISKTYYNGKMGVV